MSENYKDGNIKRSEISHEMRSAYLKYSMSVIVGRALPDVRDGLKPVHRRILYSMYEQGVTHDKPYKKSARSVGDIMGKYHPHGDVAIYDALVRLAQDFSMRYPFVDGHGNFGSVDGDSPAHMRYTEARLQRFALEMMRDIDKETVDFVPNYDGEEMEPTVLPAVVPNLLINGSAGIAVGMATNIPPHNLNEVVDGINALIDNPDIEIEQLMHYIKGPDFPTYGLILGQQGIKDAYLTGRGAIKMRAKTHVEVTAKGKQRIVVTELPYQVNKARLIERMANLVREKIIEGITEIRDESSGAGIRVVIELKADAVAKVVLNRLYKHTQMQDTFGAIMIALVDNQPQVLNLKEILQCYVKHQMQVVERRCRFDLAKAQERAHILEGLKIALDYIDEVVATIRNAANPDEARTKLMERFGLSYKQAAAILEMRLRALTGLEHGKIDAEYAELIKTIAYLEQVLSSERMMLGIIKEQLVEIKNKFGDERRTTIVGEEGAPLDEEDLIAQEDMVITISHAGYIKRLNLNTYRQQKRGGRGVTGMTTRDEDFVEQMFVATTHDYLLIFTSRGRAFRLKVHEVPEVGRTARGSALVNLLALDANEKLRTVIPITSLDRPGYLVMATRNGTVKRTELAQFKSRQNGLAAISLQPDDDLIAVLLTDGGSDVLLATEQGMVCRFSEEDMRPMGRAARGVKGISLLPGDRVVAMTKVEENSHLLVVSKLGFGKRTALTQDNYRRIGRGGKGVYTMRCSEKTGPLVTAMNVREDDELMLITKGGMVIRINSGDVSEQSRITQGVTLINLEGDDAVMDVARVATKEETNAKEQSQQAGLEVRDAEDDAAHLPAGLRVKEEDKQALEQQQIGDLLARAEADAEDLDEE